jgi:hypothetical protein
MSEPPGPSHRKRHVELRTQMERNEQGALVFRARCSCGWVSEIIRAEETLLAWEEHVEGTKPKLTQG